MKIYYYKVGTKTAEQDWGRSVYVEIKFRIRISCMAHYDDTNLRQWMKDYVQKLSVIAMAFKWESGG